MDIPTKPFLAGYVIVVLLASLAVCSGCTGTGSPCSTDDGCPVSRECRRGKCEPIRAVVSPQAVAVRS